jgi:signal transduction histidine kinase/CheY-like chemotaxis protein/HAMP domain-containing protein
MHVTLRAKLAAIVGSVAIALVAAVLTNVVVARRVDAQLATMQEHLIPKLTLGPNVERDFASLKRAYQDAVAANDIEALDATRTLRDRVLERLDGGREFLDPAASAAFRAAFTDYSDSAVAVSRRMMAGEGGELLVDAMAQMQRRRAEAEQLLASVTAIDENDLKKTFRVAREAEATGARTQLVSTLASFALVLALSLWVSRSLVRSLGLLEDGFRRFATGNLEVPIEVLGNDEISRVATEANRMAENLARLGAEQERTHWIKAGIVELTETLRGELDEAEVAARSSRVLARYLGAPASALYVARHEGEQSKLVLLSHQALTRGIAPGDVAPAFHIGEGLVGEAARTKELLVLDPAPPDFVRVRSGLGESAPRAIVVVPLVRGDEISGVLELALFESLSERGRELLSDAREVIAVSLAVAQSVSATARLLAHTQEQAARLGQQEEELKTTNEELRCQQEELQQTNEELAEHARELAKQRAALEEKNADLEKAGRRLEQQAAELTTVSAYKSQFLANMSHELRTPLNSMLLLSKLLADNAEARLSAKEVEYSKTIHSAGKDLLLLINQVLDLAKVESGKQDVDLKPRRLDGVIDRVRQVFAPLATEKGLDLLVEIQPGLPETIVTDDQRLGQILTNLVGNAIKFTDDGEVKLRVGRPSTSATFRNPKLARETTIAFAVSDSGPGIAPQHQGRIFAPFEQVDGSARRKQGGTGLGLSISRELAGLLGGELQLESRPGAGSTFTCFLPDGGDAPASADERRAPVVHAMPDRTTEEHPSDVHLLLIEDDPVFTEVLGQIIHERGLVYRTAKDGTTGLRLARELRPRGIILDVKLPDLDGWHVMEKLRAHPKTASIPVHFISGVAMPERGLAMGATGYLVKPAEREDLVRAIEELSPRIDRASHRVLVLEENTTESDSLVEQLTSAGLSAVRATSKSEALGLLDREQFACMIVDLSLPEVGELDLLDALMQRRGGAMPGVVVYTRRQLNRSEVARLEAYAEAVILKGGEASTERLIDEIRLFLRRLESGLGGRSPAPRTRDVDVRLEGKKILVVDDDMRTAYALSATLRGKGAEVLVADNGSEALSVLTRHPDVHAVLMDVMMPEMDGHEATRQIRRQTAFERLPIIALTAKAMKGDEARCIEAGASAYLPKPVDADSLLALLHAHLRAPDDAT